MSAAGLDKPALRARLRALRKAAASPAVSPAAALSLRDRFLGAVPLPEGAVVAGYVAAGSEIDPAPLLRALAARGFGLALPCIVEPDLPLVFRRWTPGEPLAPGRLGIPEPPAAAATLRPGVVLVPLLGFDRRGRRLGQGGGFYDRTLAGLDALTVGLAYALQEVDAVPVEPWDRRLDWVVTENEAIRT